MKSIKELIREQVKINESITATETDPGEVRESGQPAVPDVVVATETPQKKRRGRKPRVITDG